MSASVPSVIPVNFAETSENIDESAHLSACVSTGTDGRNGGGGENRTPVRTGVTTASTRVSDLLISLRELPTVRPSP